MGSVMGGKIRHIRRIRQAVSTPHMAHSRFYARGKMRTPSRKILQANLKRAWDALPELGGNRAFGKRHGIGEGTVARARNGHVDVTLDTLDQFALAFKVAPADLLTPGFNPGTKAQTPAFDEETARFAQEYQRLSAAARKKFDALLIVSREPVPDSRVEEAGFTPQPRVEDDVDRREREHMEKVHRARPTSRNSKDDRKG